MPLNIVNDYNYKQGPCTFIEVKLGGLRIQSLGSGHQFDYLCVRLKLFGAGISRAPHHNH